MPEGATATDLVLTITEMLRKHGVVGKFVEFYGPGVGAVPLANRATIGNMSPEYGSTVAIFPIDAETIALPAADRPRPSSRSRWSRRTRRSRACGTTRTPSRPTPRRLELDLSTIVPSLAGPKRPQDRVPLAHAKTLFRAALTRLRRTPTARVRRLRRGESPSRSRPPTRPADPAATAADDAARAIGAAAGASAAAGQADPVRVTGEDGTEFELDHGAVVIAAITSCTNTSNPQVMIGAALLARNAVERGPDPQAVGEDHAGARAPRWSWTTTSGPA